MNVKNLVEILHQWADPSLQESYDNSGLITGSPDAAVSGVLICLDSTEAVIDEAISYGANVVVAHHPIVFSGLKKITGRTYIERVIIKAIQHEIAIIAIHTNLDNLPLSGVNSMIASKLCLEDTRVLRKGTSLLNKVKVYVPEQQVDQLKDALFKAGAGSIGNYDECSFSYSGTGSFRGNDQSDPYVGEKNKRHHEKEQCVEVIFPSFKARSILSAMYQAHPYEEVAYDLIPLDNEVATIGSGLVGELSEVMEFHDFLEHTKNVLQCKVIRYAGKERPIKKVALCGGSGSFLLSDAKRSGADIFITADYKYHQFFDAENDIIIADVGHYESEQYTIQLIYDYLMQKNSNFALYCTKINTNPVKYFI